MREERQLGTFEHEPVDLADLLGVDQSEVGELVASPENLLAQIKTIAAGAMTDRLTDECVIDGQKYRVSKGDEHFPNTPGKLDQIIKENNPQFFGFRLYQKIPKSKGDYSSIILVQNGAVSAPLLHINPITGHITDNSGMEFVEGVQELGDYLSIIGSISIDSENRARQEESQKHFRRRKVRNRLIGAGLTAGLIFGTLKGGPIVIDSYQDWNQDRLEEEARREAEERAEEQAAREARDESIREFDSSNDIEGAPAFPVDSVGVAVPSDQFMDQTVPSFEDEIASEDVAHDITHPREIDLEFNENGDCTTIEDVPLRPDRAFEAIHNGGNRRVIAFLPSSTENSLQVCDLGTVGDGSDLSGSEADTIVIQVRPLTSNNR